MYGRVIPLSIWLTSLFVSARAMVEDTVLDRACVNKRIKRLCEKASLSELVQTEAYLRNPNRVGIGMQLLISSPSLYIPK